MDFFKTGIKSVLGAGTSEHVQQQNHGATVDKLVDRVTSSTLLEDRRDAVRALKSLSRKFRIEVGAQAMGALVQVLEQDRADCEIIGYALDTLVNITSEEQFDEELENPQVSMNVGEQFTEMFIKDTNNVTLALSYLEEFDFRVRWPAIKLLTILLGHRPKDLQDIVLVSPMAVSKLMDLLGDTREIIRNDALLLLIQLTKGNANIQKIVAFENAFDRIFDVIRDECASDGGIVVEDCLILMLHLLKNNTSNQQFFKEGSYIQRLAPMFVLPPELDEAGWSPQKVSNVHCMLQVVRTLVSPLNSGQVVTACQRIIKLAGVLEALCNILMSSGVPAEILTETINTVAEMVRGHQESQEYLAGVMAPSNPPRPALVVLLMSMVNEKQPLGLRCAVLYCFQCFLYKNEVGQAALIQTLLPSTESSVHAVSTLTQGQLLCDGLFSVEPLANWFSATALMYGLIENPGQKEQLLRVLLASTTPGGGGEAVSLLHQTVLLLQQPQTKHHRGPSACRQVGLLMLLSTWLSHCPVAVKHFLAVPNSVSHLIAQISANEHDDNECLIQGLCAFLMGICIQYNDNTEANFKRTDLAQVVVKRISTEIFVRKLGEVSKHESYSRAVKQPLIRMKVQGTRDDDVQLDYEFCKLFKAMETVITKMVLGLEPANAANNPHHVSMMPEEQGQAVTGIVAQYQGIIRDQDGKITALEGRVQQLEGELSGTRQQLMDCQVQHSQAHDQNILLKAQLAAATDLVNQLKMANLDVNGGGPAATAASSSATEQRLQETVVQLQHSVEKATAKLLESGREMDKLRKDQEDLLELLTDNDEKMSDYRRRLRALGAQVSEDDDDDEEDNEQGGGGGTELTEGSSRPLVGQSLLTQSLAAATSSQIPTSTSNATLSTTQPFANYFPQNHLDNGLNLM